MRFLKLKQIAFFRKKNGIFFDIVEDGKCAVDCVSNDILSKTYNFLPSDLKILQKNL